MKQVPSPYRIAVSLCYWLILFTVSACASAALSATDSLLLRLRNRGPVALSSDNPYLAGNLLIAREMEANAEIRGFVQHRGAPAALEVKSEWLSPTLMEFYYPENREQFTLEESDGVWIIRGPVMIQREKMKEVAGLTRNIQGEPKIALDDGSSAEPKAAAGQSVKTPPSPPAPKTAKQPSQEEDPFLSKLNALDEGHRSGKEGPFSSPAFQRYDDSVPGRQSAPPRISSTQEDENFIKDLIQQFGTHPAELSPKGDVVHYVTYAGETLILISRWYTFDRNNAARIARINRLKNPNMLSIGDEIIIPSYLVRNKNRLTEEAMQALLLRD